ncbi:putative secreted protein (Por secretion system target) [Marinirhabdus gelatinilytica]|uniref:Putative secreted protein (Por secretion system target) n=2 Tax=Marinirhabdus gelatinilytica TaxID=1703343 RepID=A0A370QIP1_9FLAO|nr:putative secreted protein (Por secretion system target) [Marinirhabdus gelatinilytica]
MKKLHLIALAALFTAFASQAQLAEQGPADGVAPGPQVENSNALFDVEFIYDVGVTGSIGAQSQAGVIFFNDQYWVSTWNADTIHILDEFGGFVETFTIPGVSGTRGFTTDGTRLWIGAATLEIFEIDPVARTVINTINVTTTSDATARMAAYDPNLDGGNGGFWIGSFSSDIASVDMDGNELSVVTQAEHGQNLYGGVVDVLSPGGPYLWVHHLPGAVGDPDRDQIVQLSLPDALPTGVVYDFFDDAPAGTTEVVGGGIAISPAGEATADAVLIGLCQCSPSNLIFGIELIGSLGVDENQSQNFTMAPNPASGNTVAITSKLEGAMNVEVFDVTGKKVIQTNVDRDLDISSLSAGVYMVRINQNEVSVTKKLIVN